MLDIQPPKWIHSYPRTVNTTASAVELVVQLDEPGVVYYLIVPDTARAPTSREVKAGPTLRPDVVGPVQVDPGYPVVFAVDPTLAFRDFQRLKLKHDKLLSNVAFKMQPAPLQRGAERQHHVPAPPHSGGRPH